MTKPDARGRLDPVEHRRAGAEPASLGYKGRDPALHGSQTYSAGTKSWVFRG